MLRVIRLVGCAVALAGAVGVQPAVAQSVVAGPTTTQMATGVGDRITVPVAVDMRGASGVLLGAYTLRMAWDPGVLRFTGTVAGSFPTPVVNADSAAQGVVRLAAAQAAGAGGLVTLGGLTLEVLTTASSSQVAVSFSELTAAGTFQDLLPITTVTTLTFCPGELLGDLTADGRILANDALVVLMHAVGLAVTDTTAGDVDDDGKVNPRDALVILSAAVGLDVSAFRIGQYASGTCTPGMPATVTFQPDTLRLPSGDVLRAQAAVQDTAGGLLGGVNLAWTSLNPAVATVDSTGAVTGVAVGTTSVIVAAAPGIVDTAVVIVDARHRWVVNPTVAAGQARELGTPVYPFSTIAAAIARASNGDTVQIGIATYHEPLTTTKRLVFRGDSGAAGMPVISTPNQAVGKLSVTGTQAISRLEFRESQAGLVIEADTVMVQSVRFRAIRGVAIRIPKAQYVGIVYFDVDGAVGAGVLVDTAHVVAVTYGRVAGIGESLEFGGSAGVGVWADTAVVYAVDVTGVPGGPGVWIAGADWACFVNGSVTFADGGIMTDSVRFLHLDTLDLRRVHVGIGAWNTDSVSAAHVTADSVDVGVAAEGFYQLALADSRIRWAAEAGVSVSDGRTVRVDRTTFEHNRWAAMYLTADTAIVDGAVIDSAGVGVHINGFRVGTVDHSTITHVGEGVVVEAVDSAAMAHTRLTVANTVIRNVRDYGVRAAVDTLRMLNDTLERIGTYGVVTGAAWDGRHSPSVVSISDSRIAHIGSYGVYTWNGGRRLELVRVTTDSTRYGAYVGYVDTVAVRSSSMSNSQSRHIYAYGPSVLDLQDNTFSRTGSASIRLYNADSAFVRGNVFQEAGGQGLYVDYSTAAAIVPPDPVLIVRANQFRNNASGGVDVYMRDMDGSALVDSNTFRETAGWFAEAWAYDTLTGHVEVRHNTFTGVLNDTVWNRAIGLGALRTMIVENNAIDSVMEGIVPWPGDTILVRNNTITNVGGSYGIDSRRGRLATFENNAVTCTDSNNTVGVIYDAGPGSILHNTVNRCWVAYAHYNYSPAVRLVARGNTAAADGAVIPPINGFLVRGAYQAEIVGNTVSGGAFGGIEVEGNHVYEPTALARVDSNTVQGGEGIGIGVVWADTISVRGNTVTAIAHGWLGSGGILVSEPGQGRIVGNTVTGNADIGIWISATSTEGPVTVDSNLVADNGGIGLVVHNSAMTGVHNSFLRNAVGVMDSAGGSVFQQSNIEGNQFGVLNMGASPVDVSNSWWGDALGPRCDSILGCNQASTGDSVSANVTFLPVAADTVVDAPLGAPPLFAAVPTIAGPAGGYLRPARVDAGLTPGQRAMPTARGGGAGDQAQPEPEANEASAAPQAAAGMEPQSGTREEMRAMIERMRVLLRRPQ